MGNKSLLLLLLLGVLALAALVAVSSATPLNEPFIVHGRVYCDTCRCGFETNVTTYIPGAKVRLECKGRDDVTLAYTSEEEETDEIGSYKIRVESDRGDEMCDVVLVSSPWPHCNEADDRRRKTRVIVTNSNGIISPHRQANNLGFLMDHSLPVCAPLVRYYLHAYE